LKLSDTYHNFSETESQMTTKTWRGGMIGAGAWSDVQLNAWARVENAQIVALCDRHPERRDPIIERFGIAQAFDDFETMLDEADLDFVDICTRPYSHASLSRLAANKGLPVLCQKPFCESLGEAREVIDHCDQAGVRLMINENFRWQAWYRKIKELLNSGQLGKPFFARIHRRLRVSLPEFDHRQAYMQEMPRWAVYEVGVHYLDVFRFLFGDPDIIYCRLHYVSPHVKGEDVQLITAGYKNLTCTVNQSFASVPLPGIDRPDVTPNAWNIAHGLQIDGTRGTLILKPDRTLHLYTDTAHTDWSFPEDTFALSRAAAQQHFIDCLESGDQFETNGPETLKTMALVYACYLSAEEGRVVSPREIIT
jgi:predicted dehydrogenase